MCVLFFFWIRSLDPILSMSDYGREKWIQVRHVHFPLIYKVVRHICRRLVVIFTLIRLDNIWITWQCCIICLRYGSCCMAKKNQFNKIRDYDRHKLRACVDLFLKVTRSSILTIIINRDEIFDYVILSDRFLWYTLWEIGISISTCMQVGKIKSTMYCQCCTM